eukprot:gene12118-biopygen4910
MAAPAKCHLGSWCINTLSQCSHCNCERRCAQLGLAQGSAGASQQPGMELQCNLCALALQLDGCMAQ